MMIMHSILTGVRKFKGDVDGTFHDTTTVFLMTEMDDSRGTACGRATQPYKYGTSENYDLVVNLLKNGDVPVICHMKKVTNGKGKSEDIITAIKPQQEPK